MLGCLAAISCWRRSISARMPTPGFFGGRALCGREDILPRPHRRTAARSRGRWKPPRRSAGAFRAPHRPGFSDRSSRVDVIHRWPRARSGPSSLQTSKGPQSPGCEASTPRSVRSDDHHHRRRRTEGCEGGRGPHRTRRLCSPIATRSCPQCMRPPSRRHPSPDTPPPPLAQADLPWACPGG